jgi:hypothetical protein
VVLLNPAHAGVESSNTEVVAVPLWQPNETPLDTVQRGFTGCIQNSR